MERTEGRERRASALSVAMISFILLEFLWAIFIQQYEYRISRPILWLDVVGRRSSVKQ